MDPVDIRTPLTVKFRFYNSENGINLMTACTLFTLAGECIFDVCCNPAMYDAGVLEGECTIPGNFLNDGSYYFSLIFVKDSSQQLFYLEECLHFDVDDYREGINWYGKWMGYVRPQFPFSLTPVKTTVALSSPFLFRFVMKPSTLIPPERISVVIPCYNHGAYLATAINSVLAQNYQPFEIIVVDDGSTDNTKEVACGFEKVQYLYQTNQGLSAARNTGIKRSTGDYIIFTDADDWFLPDALETNLELLQTTSGSGLCFRRA